MNTAQRKYLIDQIEEQRKQQVKDLREKMPEAPNLANYLFHSIMKGTLQLKTQEEVLGAIKKKALAAKPDENWLRKGSSRRYYDDDDDSKPTIELTIGSIIVIPDEYRELWDKYKAKRKMIEGL